MSALADAPLATLTAELADFLHLPDDLDLPQLCSVQLLRERDSSEWEVSAQLGGNWAIDDVHDYEQIRAWAATGDGQVNLGAPHAGGFRGSWREISATISFVGVRVKVWTLVCGDFEPPQSADQVAAALLLETAGTGTDGAPC